MIVAVSLTSAPAGRPACRTATNRSWTMRRVGRRESDRGTPGLDWISKAIIELLQSDGRRAYARIAFGRRAV